MRQVLSERTPFAPPLYFGVAALVFIASAATTIRACAAMSAMPAMPMPGGWTMSMMWMRMPGQSWLAVAASFVAMWAVMMVAMMLPPLVAMLTPRADAAIAGTAYFLVWTAIGALLFPLGAALAAVAMQHPTLARIVPTAAALLIVVAGTVQFTAWKARRLACCRALRALRGVPAWQHGVRLAIHCAACCANLMTIMLLLGVMDVRIMTAGTAAIAVERLTPDGRSAARAIGAIAIGTGLFLLTRAMRVA